MDNALLAPTGRINSEARPSPPRDHTHDTHALCMRGRIKILHLGRFKVRLTTLELLAQSPSGRPLSRNAGRNTAVVPVGLDQLPLMLIAVTQTVVN